jgi:hypothetical protein
MLFFQIEMSSIVEHAEKIISSNHMSDGKAIPFPRYHRIMEPSACVTSSSLLLDSLSVMHITAVGHH